MTTLRDAIVGYSRNNTYLATKFASARCKCGGRTFRVAIDDTEGAAVRTCARCKREHAMGDSADYLEGADLEECACPCGNETFAIMIGVSLYEGSKDVRWLYVGLRCSKCKLAAVYGDWKNELDDYRKLLAKV